MTTANALLVQCVNSCSLLFGALYVRAGMVFQVAMMYEDV